MLGRSPLFAEWLDLYVGVREFQTGWSPHPARGVHRNDDIPHIASFDQSVANQAAASHAEKVGRPRSRRN